MLKLEANNKIKIFQVIIPVVNIRMLNTLLSNICENTVLPSSVIIINNSTRQITLPKSSGISFRMIEPDIPMYVNDSWNMGISHLSECDFVSILNDDIEIPRTFFERIAKGFKSHSNAGAICPCTVTNRADIIDFPLTNGYMKMKKKEGWAYTIRKDILDTIPPIHPSLKLFYGDDWFWWHVYRGGSGCLWYKDHGTVIYHAVGVALRRLCSKERSKQKKKEKKAWLDLKNKFLESGEFAK